MYSCLSICPQKNGHRNLKKISKHVQASFFFLQSTEGKIKKEFSWAWYKNPAHLEFIDNT